MNQIRSDLDDNKLIALAVRHDMGLSFPMIWLGHIPGKEEDAIGLALIRMYRRMAGNAGYQVKDYHNREGN